MAPHTVDSFPLELWTAFDRLHQRCRGRFGACLYCNWNPCPLRPQTDLEATVKNDVVLLGGGREQKPGPGAYDASCALLATPPPLSDRGTLSAWPPLLRCILGCL